MSVHEDAIKILRVLEENGIVMGYGMKNAEIISRTGLSQEAHDKAEKFLLQGNYIDGGGGEPNAKRWLTSLGISYLKQIMAQRVPINLDAERILAYVINSTSRPLQGVERSQIQAELEFNDDQYIAAIQILFDFELAERSPMAGVFGRDSNEDYHSKEKIRATKTGRQAFHRGFRDPQAGIQPSQIFNINAPSNIQAIASAINSQIEQQIEQTISANDPDALREMTSELLKGLVDIVGQDLNIKEQAEYTQAAAELQNELDKPDLEVDQLQKWIARLAFLDHAFSVGEKAISLSSKVLPTVMMLAKIIAALMNR